MYIKMVFLQLVYGYTHIFLDLRLLQKDYFFVLLCLTLRRTTQNIKLYLAFSILYVQSRSQKLRAKVLLKRFFIEQIIVARCNSRLNNISLLDIFCALFCI